MPKRCVEQERKKGSLLCDTDECPLTTGVTKHDKWNEFLNSRALLFSFLLMLFLFLDKILDIEKYPSNKVLLLLFFGFCLFCFILVCFCFLTAEYLHFSLCVQMEAEPAKLVVWLFGCLSGWIFYFYLYFLAVFPEINYFSSPCYFSLSSTIEKLKRIWELYYFLVLIRKIFFSSIEEKESM